MNAGIGESNAAAAIQGDNASNNPTMVAKCDQRACESKNGRNHLDRPSGGFTLRLLQLIVIGGVFEVGQVERVRMSHDEFLDVDSQLFLQELLVDVAQRLEE